MAWCCSCSGLGLRTHSATVGGVVAQAWPCPLEDHLEMGWRISGRARSDALWSARMIYRFEEFELDRSKVELRRNGEVVPVEPQVFAVLLLLAENRERLVSRDELIEKVWDGRIVSDSALDSRIKSARRAIGDDGKAQRFIRTIHGQGFRFVGEVREAAGTAVLVSGGDAPRLVRHGESKPSIAVLPFRLLGSGGPYAT